MINQKLEVIDGTFDVWVYLRESMVDWLFEVFVRSADRAAQRKMNSFVLFKCNMDDIKKNTGDSNSLLVNVYARLKNLIYDDIPKIVWEQKYEIPNPLPKDKLLQLSPEAFKKLKANQDIRDNINEWVEDTLFSVILRKQYDNSDKDKALLYLYRLLAIKYRITYPLKGERFRLDEDLRIVLESKICNAALTYFNTPLHDAVSSTQKMVQGSAKKASKANTAISSVPQSSLRSKSTGNSQKNKVPNRLAGAESTKQPKFNPEGHNSDYLRGGQQQYKPHVPVVIPGNASAARNSTGREQLTQHSHLESIPEYPAQRMPQREGSEFPRHDVSPLGGVSSPLTDTRYGVAFDQTANLSSRPSEEVQPRASTVQNDVYANEDEMYLED